MVDHVLAGPPTSPPIVNVAQSLGAFSAPMAVDELGAQKLIFVNAKIPAPGPSSRELDVSL